MKINKAFYGNKNVLDIIQKYVKNNILSIKASNDIFGDPQPGIFKYLEINIDDIYYKIPENQYFIYPKSDKDILGIFYTNNNVPKVVNYCLHDLEKFINEIDIITCVWKPISNNPFFEIIAMTQSANHLNIILQILQLLYTAKQYKNYKYVAFLEHDVLYPKNYFNFDNFNTNCIVNMNYIGLSKKGFQRRMQDDQPLHQMIMKFDYAIDYFYKKIIDAILYGSVILEPESKNIRSTKSPAIHINHKQHFTSHYSIYSTTNTYSHDDEWGSYEKLKDNVF